MEALGRKLLAWNQTLLWLVGLLNLSCILYVLFQDTYFPGEFGNLPTGAPAYMHSAKQLMMWVVLVIPLAALPFYFSAALLIMSAYPLSKKAVNLLLLLVTAFTYFVFGAFICW